MEILLPTALKIFLNVKINIKNTYTDAHDHFIQTCIKWQRKKEQRVSWTLNGGKKFFSIHRNVVTGWILIKIFVHMPCAFNAFYGCLRTAHIFISLSQLLHRRRRWKWRTATKGGKRMLLLLGNCATGRIFPPFLRLISPSYSCSVM